MTGANEGFAGSAGIAGTEARATSYATAFEQANQCVQRGDLAGAAQSYRRAIEQNPHFAPAHNNLGNLLARQGDRAQAEFCFRQAIGADPHYGRAHVNLANILCEKGDICEAERRFRAALTLDPSQPAALCSIGRLLSRQHEPQQAEACCRRALRLAPALAEPHTIIGNLLFARYDLQAAEASYGRAAELNPRLAEPFIGLGNLFFERRDLDQAESFWRHALHLAPRSAEAHANLGFLHVDRSDPEAAIGCFAEALAIDPTLGVVRSALVHLRRMICDWRSADADWQGLAEALQSGAAGIRPFDLLNLPSSPADQLACARRTVAIASGGIQPLPARPRVKRDKIRIGYLSPDFRAHPVAQLTAALFEAHDRRQFEVIGYSNGPDDGSPMRTRLQKGFDRFVDLFAMPDAASAARIHADEIDILVDLGGHTKGRGLSILAFRPAPIQVNFLGYPGTSGADFVDYLIGDAFVAPMSRRSGYTETLVHLPECFMPNDTDRPAALHNPTRDSCGLPQQGFVFCGFNQSIKISPDVFALWMRVLSAVPDSVLWLSDGKPAMKDNLRREAERLGVAPARLIFAPRLPDSGDHLARYGLADLFLDSFPYNAHTTAADALWIGLPVLTCAGETFASRVAGSLLTHTGLPEMVTTSPADYERLAVQLASDPERLAKVRVKLIDSRNSANLFKIGVYTRHLEEAYRRFYDLWRAGKPPEAFVLTTGTFPAWTEARHHPS